MAPRRAMLPHAQPDLVNLEGHDLQVRKEEGNQHPISELWKYIGLSMLPICSMYIHVWYLYGIFTYIWVIFRANAGKYSIHAAYGL